MSAVALNLEAPPAPPQRRWLLLLALAAVTAVTSWYSLTLTRFDGGVASLWLANGVLTGVLMVTPRETWRWWVLASGLAQFAVRFANDSSWALGAALVLINLLESGIVAWWVRRRVDDLRVTTALNSPARDAVIGALVGCLVSASLAWPLLAISVATPPMVTWASWFASHLLGMVVVGTLTVCALRPRVGVMGRSGHRIDYLVCLSLLVGTCLLVFGQQRYPLLFVCYLPLLLLCWRHGLSGMVVGVVVLAATSGYTAAQDAGPFALVHNESPLARMLFWNLYIAAGCLLAYSTAVALTGHRQLERRLLASESRYRLLAEEAERLARFDSLTGVANRRQFDEALAAATARAQRTGAPLLLLLLDLDHFKAINDTLGHAGGDAVLREFARRVCATVFDVDLVARLGGDEFAVLVEYSSTPEAGKLIAARLVEAMREPFNVEGVVELQVGASIGIGVQAPVNSPARLMALADKALYEAKGRGRNTWALRAA